MFSIKYVLPNEGIQRLNGKVSTFYAHKKFDQLNIAVYVKFLNRPCAYIQFIFLF